MSVLLGRELRLLLLSPLGTVLLSVWSFCCGALFLMELTAFEQAEQRALAVGDPALVALLDVNDLLLGAVFGNLVVLFLFLAPLLAMRLFADDRATRDWLAFAAPGRTSVALGKVSAGVVVSLVLVAGTLVFPLFLAVVGRPAPGSSQAVVDLGQTLVATATVGLCAAAFVAIAVAVTASVDVPLAGGLLGFLILVVLWLMPGAASLTGPTLGGWLVHLSPSSHVERGLRGVIDIGDVLYFVTLLGAATATTMVALRRGT